MLLSTGSSFQIGDVDEPPAIPSPSSTSPFSLPSSPESPVIEPAAPSTGKAMHSDVDEGGDGEEMDVKRSTNQVKRKRSKQRKSSRQVKKGKQVASQSPPAVMLKPRVLPLKKKFCSTG